MAPHACRHPSRDGLASRPQWGECQRYREDYVASPALQGGTVAIGPSVPSRHLVAAVVSQDVVIARPLCYPMQSITHETQNAAPVPRAPQVRNNTPQPLMAAAEYASAAFRFHGELNERHGRFFKELASESRAEQARLHAAFPVCSPVELPPELELALHRGCPSAPSRARPCARRTARSSRCPATS